VRVIKPVAVTQSVLTYSNVNAISAQTFDATQRYAKGDRVQVDARLYQSLQDGNTGKDPVLAVNELWWVDAGPTNRWAMFDNEINTQTVVTALPGAPTEIHVVLAPGMCNSLALLELSGAEVEVSVTDGEYPGAPLQYQQVIALDNTIIEDWYQYFFEPFTGLSEVTLTDLPPFGSARITVIVRGAGRVAIGNVIAGTTHTLGQLQWGARVGINDYSKKSTNDFGATTLVRRAYSKRAEVRLMIDTDNLERVHRLLSDLRSTVCLWIGSVQDARMSPLNILGFYKEFSIDITLFNRNYCTLSLEGMI
jgi:hypothetical protein